MLRIKFEFLNNIVFSSFIYVVGMTGFLSFLQFVLLSLKSDAILVDVVFVSILLLVGVALSYAATILPLLCHVRITFSTTLFYIVGLIAGFLGYFVISVVKDVMPANLVGKFFYFIIPITQIVVGISLLTLNSTVEVYYGLLFVGSMLIVD